MTNTEALKAAIAKMAASISKNDNPQPSMPHQQATQALKNWK